MAKASTNTSRVKSVIDRPASEFVRTKVQLHKALNISRTVVDRFFKMPGCPSETSKGFHLPSFIAFAKVHYSRPNDTLDALSGGAVPAGATSDLASVRMRHMLTQILKIEQQMAIERGEYVKREDLQKELSAFLTELDMQFRRQFEQELPQALEGCDALTIRTKLRSAFQHVKSSFTEKLRNVNIYEEDDDQGQP